VWVKELYGTAAVAAVRQTKSGIESPLDLLSRPRKKSKKSRKEPPPA
jgi:hypothetical protein